MNSFIKVFASRRMAALLFLGFSSGLPLGLTGGTLQAWMSDAKVDLTIIGIFSLVGLPYGFKFLFAPLLDRYAAPIFFGSLGRRRGWMLFTQACLMITIGAMAFSDPARAPAILATLAVLVAFSSACQDIAVDAYRIEVLTKEEYGAGAGVGILGYRMAMLVSTSLALVLAQYLSWKSSYLTMAGFVLIGMVTTLLAPEPKNQQQPRSLGHAVTLPFREFFKRKGAIETLIFLLLYKLDVMMTLAMTTPFILSIGFSKTDLAAVVKGFGMGATIVGTLVGGGFMARLGMERALWFFGVAQAFSGFSYMLLAHLGHSYPMMVVAVTLENLCSGMGIAAFSGFMMSLCDRRYTATQYALLTSFMALSRYLAQAPSGYFVKAMGWEHYFLVCALAGVPGLLLLTRFKKWSMPSQA